MKWISGWRALYGGLCWGYGLVVVLVNVMTPAAMAAQPFRLLAFGDSLTAGYNLPADQAFPVRLQAALTAEGQKVEVINAGVSGDTTGGGLARLDWALGNAPDAAILELGANDALRGIDPARTAANLDAMLEKFHAKGVPVLLAGMMAPRNMGEDYVKAFDAIYPALSAKWKLPLYPFFLDGVLMTPGMTQDDGLHPTGRGVDRIVAGILPAVRTLLATANHPPGRP